MKRYRFLTDADMFQEGDEVKLKHHSDNSWRKIHISPSYLESHVRTDGPWEYRRPVPFEGRVAFLVNYSPMIRVEIDTTGLTDEEIDQKISEEAKHKLWLNYKEHLDNFHENIDWENTKVDEECSATTIPDGY